MYNQQNLYAQGYQQYRPIYQQPAAQQQSFIGLKGRPVASMEEARASIIDFDGSIFYFPDLANKRIYTKQINIDGTALLSMYELREIPLDVEPNPSQYITREEFEAAIAQLQANIAPAPAPTEAKPKLNF